MSILRRGPKPGTVWEGSAAFCTDYALVKRPGFYALSDDGKSFRKPLLRLVMIDDAPGDDEDGACHLEVAGNEDPPQRAGRVVDLSSATNGSADVGVG
jgi:hypothetical protein